MNSRRVLPAFALFLACVPWALLALGTAYAYSFVTCAPGAGGAIVDHCANIVLWCASIGWWVSAAAFVAALVSFFESRNSFSVAAAWVSGVYCLPIVLFVAFLALH